MRQPFGRLLDRLPRPARVILDWVVTIAGAILIVLAIKTWVVNPYRIPTSSMEPTLHCARPGDGCEARFSDRVLAARFLYAFSSPKRGQIVVFKTPPAAAQACGDSGGDVFVKRLIGLPGERVTERQGGQILIDAKPLKEPYLTKEARHDQSWHGSRLVPKGQYFFMGDNRSNSCDSRRWGTVPRSDLIGPVFMTYWPPNRISFH
ncbi:MAG: signal peptidase I [Gaiellaceae bacterium]